MTVGSDDGSLTPPLPPSGTQDGSTPLLLASSGGHLEVVKALVASKADVKAKDSVSDDDTIGAIGGGMGG